jgi:hypothetical protein
MKVYYFATIRLKYLSNIPQVAIVGEGPRTLNIVGKISYILQLLGNTFIRAFIKQLEFGIGINHAYLS